MARGKRAARKSPRVVDRRKFIVEVSDKESSIRFSVTPEQAADIVKMLLPDGMTSPWARLGRSGQESISGVRKADFLEKYRRAQAAIARSYKTDTSREDRIKAIHEVRSILGMLPAEIEKELKRLQSLQRRIHKKRKARKS